MPDYVSVMVYKEEKRKKEILLGDIYNGKDELISAYQLCLRCKSII